MNDVHCRVFLKVGDTPEAYFGIYQLMEPVDDNFLQRRKEAFKLNGGSHKGYLWKCQWGSSLRDTDDKCFSDGSDTKNNPYTLKTNIEQFAAAKELLKDFIDKVNVRSDEEFNAWIAKVCDVKLLLRTIAVSVAVGSWDDYWNNHNNWYLYFDSTGPDYHFYYIPISNNNYCNKNAKNRGRNKYIFSYTIGNNSNSIFRNIIPSNHKKENKIIIKAASE